MALIEPNPPIRVHPIFPIESQDYILSDVSSECSDAICPDVNRPGPASDSGVSMILDDSFNSSEGESQPFVSASGVEYDKGSEMEARSSSPKGSKKRKSATPCRSSSLDDPNFRGVTIRMENKLINSEWKLVMQSTFSLPPKKKRKVVRTYINSSEEEEVNNYTPILEGRSPTQPRPNFHREGEKHCASCSVKKTPLWRDAEDGTPLCNACGIRYKKYKLRCGTCWHIPKKDEFHPNCQYCGSFYEYVSPKQ